MKIYVVDAFTDIPFKGNPAGVCIVDNFLNDYLMQSIATELGFSNSAFIKLIGLNHYHIRWFTPISEAPLCGHATVATMHVLNEIGIIGENSEVKFESLSGELIVTKEGSWYNLNFPKFEVFDAELGSKLKDVLNIKPKFSGISDNFFFLEFNSREDLLALIPNLEKLKLLDYRALIATAPGAPNEIYDFYSRYFAPRVGINEDPVCASAHCRLIPYWSKKLSKDKMLAYQLSKRGGVIKCENLENRVIISGEAVTIMTIDINQNIFEEFKDVT